MYVIYLSTVGENRTGFNDYGYWTGKSYVVNGERYPTTIDFKEDGDVKVYKNKKVAENAAKKAYEKFGHVLSATVKDYEEIPSRS